LGYGFLYLKRLKKGLSVKQPVFYTPFWIAVAFIIYYAMLLILSSMDSYLYSVLTLEGKAVFWMMRSCLDIIKYGILMKALLVSGKEECTVYGTVYL
jgi:hypothetical protein